MICGSRVAPAASGGKSRARRRDQGEGMERGGKDGGEVFDPKQNRLRPFNDDRLQLPSKKIFPLDAFFHFSPVSSAPLFAEFISLAEIKLSFT